MTGSVSPPPSTAIICRSQDGHRLNVVGTSLRFLCTTEQTGQPWSAMENDIPFNAGPPPHSHPWAEAYYVVSGSVEFILGGTVTTAYPGDFLYAPGDTVHAFRGCSEIPAKVLIFDSPAHSQAFFQEVDQEVQAIPEDLPKIGPIGARHGVVFAPPPPAA